MTVSAAMHFEGPQCSNSKVFYVVIRRAGPNAGQRDRFQAGYKAPAPSVSDSPDRAGQLPQNANSSSLGRGKQRVLLSRMLARTSNCNGAGSKQSKARS